MRLIIGNKRADGFTGAFRHRHHLLYSDADGNPLTAWQVQEIVAGKRVLIGVHGLASENTKTKNAYEHLHSKLIDCNYDVMFGYRWAAGFSVGGYDFARGRTDEAADGLAELIAQTTLADSVVVMGHSLGCDVVLKASVICRDLFPLARAWKGTVLVAPAIWWDRELPWQTTVCFSPNDKALKAMRARSFWTKKPMGLYGPKPGIVCRREEFDYDHSDYFDDPRARAVLREAT